MRREREPPPGLGPVSRLLHVDAVGGVAGDMLLGALLDAGASLGAVRDGLGRMGVDGLSVAVERTERHGIGAAHVRVVAPDEHVHRDWAAVRALVDRAALPPRAAARAHETFRRLAEAEGRIHGVPPDRVHFHEVGGVDAIADVCGVALALEDLGIDRVQPRLGEGRVAALVVADPVPGHPDHALPALDVEHGPHLPGVDAHELDGRGAAGSPPDLIQGVTEVRRLDVGALRLGLAPREVGDRGRRAAADAVDLVPLRGDQHERHEHRDRGHHEGERPVRRRRLLRGRRRQPADHRRPVGGQPCDPCRLLHGATITARRGTTPEG